METIPESSKEKRMRDSDEFTLEKLKISERLHETEIALTKFIERFDAHTEQDRMMADRILKIIERHDKMLVGTNGHDGMKIEIDRLRQKSLMTSFIMGAITVATVGLLTKAIWSALVK